MEKQLTLQKIKLTLKQKVTFRYLLDKVTKYIVFGGSS